MYNDSFNFYLYLTWLRHHVAGPKVAGSIPQTESASERGEYQEPSGNL
jgi:hypothetical protein